MDSGNSKVRYSLFWSLKWRTIVGLSICTVLENKLVKWSKNKIAVRLNTYFNDKEMLILHCNFDILTRSILVSEKFLLSTSRWLSKTLQISSTYSSVKLLTRLITIMLVTVKFSKYVCIWILTLNRPLNIFAAHDASPRPWDILKRFALSRKPL